MTDTTTNKENLLDFVETLKLQWMNLIDAIIDPIMIVDTEYKVTKANKALASVADVENVKNVLGKKCFEIFAGRKTPCVGCRMTDSLNMGKNYTYDFDYKLGGKYYEVTSQPFVNEAGVASGVVQIYRDRTEAKNLHSQLIQSEKLASIGLLAGGIAHEINNPLGGILIFSQMLLKEMDKASPHYGDVVEIEAATQRCKEIVENLLNFARQQPGEVPKSQTPLKIKEIVDSALRFAKVASEAKKCEVFCEWDDQEIEIMGERNRYIQIFLNLFQNAFQAMPDGGTLTIVQKNNISDDGANYVFVEVRDTGMGIPPENIDQIFDPFFTTKDPGEGTGLGLAICYGMLKEMGGELSVSSELNEGTAFQLKIPKVAFGK